MSTFHTFAISPPEDTDFPITKIVGDFDRTYFQWSPWFRGAPLLRQVDLRSGRLDPVATATFSISNEGKTMVEWGMGELQPVEAFLAQNVSGLGGKILVYGAKEYHWREMTPFNGCRIYQINDIRNTNIVLVQLSVDPNPFRPEVTLRIRDHIVESPNGMLFKKIVAAVVLMCWIRDPWVT